VTTAGAINENLTQKSAEFDSEDETRSFGHDLETKRDVSDVIEDETSGFGRD
jgi:hypothetical protein